MAPPPTPPISPVSKLHQRHTERLRKRDILLTGEGKGVGEEPIHDSEEARFTINHSTLSIWSKATSCRLCLLVPLHYKDTIPEIRNIYSQKRNCAAPIRTFIFLCALFYIFPRSVYIFCCRKIGRPIVRIYKSLTNT
jgi:hypothetical protein